MMPQNELIKKLRDKTGYSIIECKKALEETRGNIKEAAKILQQKGSMISSERKDKATSTGLIDCYIHSNNKIGAMVEVRCETDFVARNKEFKKFTHHIAMQVAALDPADPKTLLAQPFIKDETQTVEDLLNEIISKTGEKIEIARFIRFQLGKD